MFYPILKAFHVISVVSWFAGLLYMVRLQVYYVEAESRPESEKRVLQDQLAIMQRRLWYGITHPAMLLTIVFGTWLMVQFQIYKQPWLHLKLLFVFGLIGYQIYVGRIRKNLLNGTNGLTSKQLRILNEVGTLFLVIIVLMAYLKLSFR